MAIVINNTNYNISITAKNGDSCMVQPGKNKVEDKFCANLPPQVKLVSLDKKTTPAVKVSAKKEKVVTQKSEKKETKDEKGKKND